MIHSPHCALQQYVEVLLQLQAASSLPYNAIALAASVPLQSAFAKLRSSETLAQLDARCGALEQRLGISATERWQPGSEEFQVG